MNDTPPISILMGIYNGEQYLPEAMDSLLAQTFTDFEILVVNDGSTDGTARLLEDYARRDSRVVVINKENGGLASALNAGLKVAGGRYVARADGDDVYDPERLQKQWDFMEEHPDIVLSGTAVMLMDPLGIPVTRHKPFLQEHEAIEGELLRGGSACLCHPSVIMRRDALLAIDGYDERWRVTEDLSLFLRIARHGRLTNIPDVLIHWRQHLGSANHRKRSLQMQEATTILAEAHAERGLAFDSSVIHPRPEVRPYRRLLFWGWNALGKGYRKKAAWYAWSVLKLRPWTLEAFMLLACVIRGH